MSFLLLFWKKKKMAIYICPSNLQILSEKRVNVFLSEIDLNYLEISSFHIREK